MIGRSLGSAVASYVASKRPVAKLALVTPFDSMANVAQAHYPWLPVRWLLQDKYDQAAYLRRYQGPLLVVRAGRDDVVPPVSTDRLIASLPHADGARPAQRRSFVRGLTTTYAQTLSAFVRPLMIDQAKCPKCTCASARNVEKAVPPSTAKQAATRADVIVHPLQRRAWPADGRAHQAAAEARDAAAGPDQGEAAGVGVGVIGWGRPDNAARSPASATGTACSTGWRGRQRRRRAAFGSSFSNTTQSWRSKLHAALAPGGSDPASRPRGRSQIAPLRLRCSVRIVTPCSTLPPTV